MPRHIENEFGTVWTFETARFRIKLTLKQDYGYRYDGDDEDGGVQEKLDSGEYVAFDSTVTVELDGVEIASDHLGGSVYAWDNVSDFFTAHRDPDPFNRNSSIMRAKAGGNAAIGHYFPDMVGSAIDEARRAVASRLPSPRLRA